MFGFLGLSSEIVLKLRGLLSSRFSSMVDNADVAAKAEYHVYMADNSRISIAGLNPGNVNYVAKAIAECLKNAKDRAKASS